MKKLFHLMLVLMMGVVMSYAQHPMGTKQAPASLSLEWMLSHPMGYLRYNEYVSMAKIKVTPDSVKKSLWENFSLKESELYMSADLKEKFAIPTIGVIDDIYVHASFNRSGSYIQNWSYFLFFKNKSMAKKYMTQVIRELKEYGYWKEDGTYINNKMKFPHYVDVSVSNDDCLVLYIRAN